MFRIAVLVSGTGTNMNSLIKNDIPIDCIIADRKCKAEEIANENKIKFFLLDRKDTNISDKILEILKERNIDLVVLAGFLSILRGEILNFYNKKIINIHPSLLPKYGGIGMHGLNVHKAVFENKETVSGCTVHYVTENVDAGSIILQKKVDISSANSPEEIQKLILPNEWILLNEVVKNIIKEREGK